MNEKRENLEKLMEKISSKFFQVVSVKKDDLKYLASSGDYNASLTCDYLCGGSSSCDMSCGRCENCSCGYSNDSLVAI